MDGGQVFLHGYLVIKIIEARDIPDMENWYSKIVDKKDVTDPFVDVKLGKTRLAKTAIIDNDLNPVWNESFKIEVCHKSNVLVFDVRDKDHAYTEEIGKVEINTQHLLDGQVMEGWFDISKKKKVNGQLRLYVCYKSMADIAETYEVDSYFPMHRGCKMTLYQDAMCPPDIPWLNMVQGPPGIINENRACWKDMYYDILAARHLICITGWAVWTKLKLFRGADAQNIYGGTLGELLCQKADEGVQIRVMIWSEKSSGDILGDEGMMGTHDMETFKYFKDNRNYRSHNQVLCALCPRELDTKELTDVLQSQFGSSMYTHHQKTVIIDGDGSLQPDGRRSLIAYVGGLDLTGGRYDSPYHPIFETLKTDHDGDYRNSNAKGTPPYQGPREPWHDIHSRVEGPAARDVLENFIERWKKQGMQMGPPPIIDDRLMQYLNPQAVGVVESPDHEWNVQFFRSITSDSAVFDPYKSSDDKMLLYRKKGRLVEQSITQAYIQMIRNAQNFIYIENQYFMGSAYEWDTDNQTLCNHTIPAEIVAKIVQKIQKGERFMAYVVIPMWPEGDPTSAPMQAILHWQKRTMEMMYREIGAALRTVRNPEMGHLPTDYLLFLCPGIRELGGPYLDVLDDPTPGSLAEIFRNTKRQMIYVHSKMMIVDDAYIIVGSANINERSMSGTRDTECAVGCWQPAYNAYNPYGNVHVFRMHLWAEHLKFWEESFRFPGTLATARKMKEMCDYNWEKYNYDFYGHPESDLPPGLLLTYPVKITADGKMENLPGFKSFPDYPSTAQVFGGKSAMIPEKITT